MKEDSWELQTQLLLSTHEVNQQMSDNICELQNGCCFTSTLQILRSNLMAQLIQKPTGKEILGHVLYPTQVDSLQSPHALYKGYRL